MTEQALNRLITMMEALRSPERGCPWDKKQTFESLVPYTLEEVHEVIHAIEHEDYDSLKDELGDLLFQVVFYAQIASEIGEFDLVGVIDHLVEKMHRRHPHVFADEHFDNEHELSAHWENVKSREKSTRTLADSILSDVPSSMPALARSQKLQNRAARVGFVWNDINRVREKLAEEINELDEALASGDNENIRHEIGDLITAAVNLARHVKLDAEQALRLANQRFENRFSHIEKSLKQQNREIRDTSLEDLETLWQLAKDELKDY